MASAESFLTSDAQLAAQADFRPVFEKYSKVADDAAIETVKAALEKKNHKVTVVATKEEALKAALAAVPEGASVHNASSTTLVRFGPISALTIRPLVAIFNYFNLLTNTPFRFYSLTTQLYALNCIFGEFVRCNFVIALIPVATAPRMFLWLIDSNRSR